MHDPLVTIYIPTRNRSTLIARAAKSVLSQTHVNLELIIVDDGSEDETHEYLHALAKEDSRVHLVFNTSNLGACASRNKAIELARGEFITGLDDDDYFQPDRISDFLNLWKKRLPDTVALISGRTIIHADGSTTSTCAPRNITYGDMFLRNVVGSQVFIETWRMKSIGGFDPILRAWQDYDLNLRILSSGSIENTMSDSYVVDTSHPHERISNSNVEKIEESCNHIIEKYQISGRNAARIKSQLLAYHFNYRSALHFVLVFLFTCDIQGLKAIAMRFYRAKILGKGNKA